MYCHKCGIALPDGAQVCPSCGTPMNTQTVVTQTVVNQEMPEEKIKNFGLWKLVSGILSMLIFVFMTLQSCAVGVVNNMNNSNDTSGTAGVVVAILILAAGITSVAGRKSRGANIAIIILAVFGALFGYTNGGTYEDLPYWTTWMVIMGVFALIAFIAYKPKKAKK